MMYGLAPWLELREQELEPREVTGAEQMEALG
jgi:hypothetical protein